MPIYSDYANILRQYNFSNLPDNDEEDDLSYPLEKGQNGSYIIKYQLPSNASILLSTGYYNEISEEYINFRAVNANQQQLIESFLHQNNLYSAFFGDVANLTFQTSAIFEADIVFMQNDGASAYAPNSLYFIESTSGYSHDYYDPVKNISSEKQYGDIIFNEDNIDGWGSTQAGYTQYHTVMHEIAHSLGLRHPTDQSIDNQKYTIMSSNYIQGMDGYAPTFTAPITPLSLQLLDIAAIQEIYGRNYGTRDTETTYSHAGAFASSATNEAFIYTIWDGGGTDIIFAADYTDHVKIDLRQGAFSSIGKAVDSSYDGTRGEGLADDNVAIAYYTVIENATGTSDADHGDILIGNAWDNILRGLDGDDYLYGDGFVYDGDKGFYKQDTLNPNTPWGPDGIAPAANGSGDDTFIGGQGNDTIKGGGGNDTVDYSAESGTSGITVSNTAGGGFNVTDTYGDADALSGIEEIVFTVRNDVLNLSGIESGKILSFDGGLSSSGDVANLSAVAFDHNTGLIYNLDGNAQVTLTGFESFDYTRLSQVTEIPNYAADVALVNGINDFSTFAGSMTVNLGSYFVRYDDAWGIYTHLYYAYTAEVVLSNGHTYAASVTAVGSGYGSYSYSEAFNELLGNFYDAVLYEGATIVGTNHGDTVRVTTSGLALFQASGFVSGTGNDHVEFAPGHTGNENARISYVYTGGADVIEDAGLIAGSITIKGDYYIGSTTYNYSGGTLSLYFSTGNSLVLQDARSGSYSPTITFETGGSFAYSGSTFVKSGSTTVTVAEVVGTWGADTFTAQAGKSQHFIGKGGNDIIHAGDMDDILDGGLGNDTLYGDAGNDTFYTGLGLDTIYDSAGTDTLAFYSGTDYRSAAITQSGTTTTITFAAGVDVLTISGNGIENVRLDDGELVTFSQFINLVALADASEFLRGDETNNILTVSSVSSSSFTSAFMYGYGGDDTLTGGAGNDVLDGGSGNDTLYGGAGNDHLIGGSGGGELYGDAGDDILESAGTSLDSITLYGGDGSDRLMGGEGYNTLDGGNGSDVMYLGRGAQDAALGDWSDGSDIFVILQGEGLSAIYSFEAGVDKIDLSNFGNIHSMADFETGTDDFGTYIELNQSGQKLMLGMPLEWLTDSDFIFSEGSGSTGSLFANPDYLSGNEDTVIKGNVFGDNGWGLDYDTNALSLTATAWSTESWVGDFQLFTNGDFIFTPTANYYGGAAFGYTITDADGHESSSYVSINVLSVNDAPLTKNDAVSGNEASIITGNVLADNGNGADSDVESQALTVTAGTFATTQGGSIIVQANGDFSYTPASQFYGDDTFIYTVKDASNAASQAVLTITVNSLYTIIEGTSGNDSLSGTSANERLLGLEGNDMLVGGTGNDVLNGGNGVDTASYAAAASGITANLSTGAATGDGTDTLISIENLIGSAYADTLTGDGNNNIFVGGAGNDTITGGLGVDTVDYSGSGSGVNANLTIGSATGEGTDTLSGIENITGSAYAETITGDANANILTGNDGNDTLYGNGGADVLNGGAGVDTIQGNAGSDTLEGGAGADSLVGNEDNDIIYGGDDGDTIYGDYNSLDETLYAYSGADTLYGGAGADTLRAGRGDDALYGENDNDTLYGGSGNDTLEGGAGSDYLYGDSGLTYTSDTGNDTLNGGAGNDNLYGQNGNDILWAGEGADNLYGGAGANTFAIYNTAGNDNDLAFVQDWNTGTNNKIDIADLLSGYNSGVDALSSFVQIAVGANTTIQIDRDGNGSTYGWDNVLRLSGITSFETNVDTLVTNGVLIAA